MAIIKQAQREQDERDFADGYATEPTAKPEVDEFDVPAEAETAAADPEAAVAADAAASEVAEPMPGEEVGPDTAAAEAGAAVAAVDPVPEPEQAEPEESEADKLAKEVQRLKSWEGRLKAMEQVILKKQAAMQTTNVADNQTGNAYADGGKVEDDDDTSSLDAAAEDTPENAPEAAPVVAIVADAADGEPKADEGTKRDPRALLSEDFGPDFVELLTQLVTQICEDKAGAAVSGVAATVDEVIAELKAANQDKHYSAIKAAHDDFIEIFESPEFAAWVGSKTPEEQEQINQIAEHGSTNAVIDLLGQYKAGRAPAVADDEPAATEPATEAPAADEPADEVGEQPASKEPADEVGDAWEAAEGVRSGGGLKLPDAPGADDGYEEAWKKA